MFKDTLMYFLGVTILVTAIIMVVSFFVTLPQPFVIVDTIILVLATAIYLFVDKKQDKDE